MTWAAYTWAQFRLSTQVYVKRIGIALTGTLVPLGLGIMMPTEAVGAAPVDGARRSVFIITGFMAFALFFTVYNLVNAVTSRRDALIYKRLRCSGLPDSSIFLGEGAAAAVPSCLVALVLMTYAVVVLGAGAPSNAVLVVGGILLGSLMFAVLAVGISGVLPGAGTAMWIVTPVMVLFMFCSGIYTPIGSLPGPLREVAAYLPMSPVVSVLRTGYLGRDFASHGALVRLIGTGAPLGLAGTFRACLGAVCIMLAWTAIGWTLARRLFRWDPHRSG
ncbi:MAG: type transport system permease protein [Mycobacterium sp.]|jgi:ABC-2 type transport system permease protein|nr:type transport system permease protein [Mycobacterium sp.]MCW2745433.1 type transport system permease protein [Mycobacterium sp.]